jgi:hypothetical protein
MKPGSKKTAVCYTICFFGVLASGFDFGPVMAGLRLLGSKASQFGSWSAEMAITLRTSAKPHVI